MTQAKTYGTDWFNKYGTDIRSFLIRDLAYIKSIQIFLDSCQCDWENFTLHPITTIDETAAKKSGINVDTLSEEEKYNYWIYVFDKLCDGKDLDLVLEFKDVVEIYSDVFLKINKSLEGRWSYKYLKSRIAPNNDVHPMPLEALNFLDTVWPNNSLSNSSRDYAKYWDEEIFKHKISKSPIHPIKKIIRF
jgi:hypothetical protein